MARFFRLPRGRLLFAERVSKPISRGSTVTVDVSATLKFCSQSDRRAAGDPEEPYRPAIPLGGKLRYLEKVVKQLLITDKWDLRFNSARRRPLIREALVGRFGTVFVGRLPLRTPA